MKRRGTRIADLDPRLALMLVSGLCPECGAAAQPTDPPPTTDHRAAWAWQETDSGQWLSLLHAPGCTVDLAPLHPSGGVMHQALSERVDLRVIDAVLGLTPGTVTAVERRANGDYALVFDPALGGGDTLRLSRRMVHGRARRWRRRNQPLWAQLLWALPSEAPAIRPERLDRGDRMLDELRAAIVRASHVGTWRRGRPEPFARADSDLPREAT